MSYYSIAGALSKLAHDSYYLILLATCAFMQLLPDLSLLIKLLDNYHHHCR